IGFVLMNIVTDGLPHVLEYAGGACEVHPCKVRVVKAYLAHNRSAGVYKVDNTVGKSSLAEYLHEDAGRVDLCVGRLPNHHITAHGRSRGQVAADGSEVERCNSQQEAFQRTVLHSVVNTGNRQRLLLVYL